MSCLSQRRISFYLHGCIYWLIQKRADAAHEDLKNGSTKESSGLMPATQPSFKTPSPAPPKPRSDNTGKKNRTSTVNKSQGEPEGIFPCKKCSRLVSLYILVYEFLLWKLSNWITQVCLSCIYLKGQWEPFSSRALVYSMCT